MSYGPDSPNLARNRTLSITICEAAARSHGVTIVPREAGHYGNQNTAARSSIDDDHHHPRHRHHHHHHHHHLNRNLQNPEPQQPYSALPLSATTRTAPGQR